MGKEKSSSLEKSLLFKSNLEGLKKALALKPGQVIRKVKKSGLCGRGGAGFPTGLKWEISAKASGEHFVLCNADEGEPGTFKDKLIISKAPLNIIEGIIIACHAVKAREAFIYLRGEYSHLKPKLQGAIRKARPFLERKGIKVTIVLGEGAYICGEETAILNSIEGRRPEPRRKPPYPAVKGLRGQPTVVNNVETLSVIPLIFLERFNPKKRLCSFSGDLKKPGVFEVVEGKKLGELVEMAKPIGVPRAVSFGASGGIIPYDPVMELTEENIKERGAWLGSCSIIVLNHTHSIVEFCESVQHFFVHESCGYCAACREGNLRILEILKRISNSDATMRDLRNLEKLCEFVSLASFCSLGRAAPNHVITGLRHFKEEFVRRCR